LSETEFKPCRQFKISSKRGGRIYILKVLTSQERVQEKISQNNTRQWQTCGISSSTGVDLEIHIRKTKRYDNWKLLPYLLRRRTVHKKKWMPVCTSRGRCRSPPKRGPEWSPQSINQSGCLHFNNASFKLLF